MCIFILGLCIGLLLNVCINKTVEEKVLIDKNKYFILGCINAISYSGLYHLYGLGFYMIKYCIFLSIMLVIATIDLMTKDIYFRVSILGIASAFMLDLYEYFILGQGVKGYIYGVILVLCIFWVMSKILRVMGDGDIEVAVICAAFLGGRYTLLAIILAIIVGGIVGIALIVSRNNGGRDEMAFIPYLLIGSYIAIFAGEFIIDWYLKSC